MTQRGQLTEPGSKATASKAEGIIWRLVPGFTRLSPSDPLQASVSGIPIPTPHSLFSLLLPLPPSPVTVVLEEMKENPKNNSWGKNDSSCTALPLLPPWMETAKSRHAASHGASFDFQSSCLCSAIPQPSFIREKRVMKEKSKKEHLPIL